MPDTPMGDPAARVGRLYDRHGSSLYKYAVMLLASGSDAEDVIQQVFAALLKPFDCAQGKPFDCAQGKPFDGAQGKHAVIENEAGYLRRAVRNECYSLLRRRRTRRAVTSLDEDEASVEQFLEAKDATGPPEERIALERALRVLPPDQREVVHLHVYEGMTFQQIADACDESINTIASRYRYALAKLRDVLT